jgi:YD repeat-containing protein
MKKTYLILLILYFTQLCVSENIFQNDRAKYGLKGNVKLLIERTFLATDKFGEIVKEDYESSVYKVIYNVNGYMEKDSMAGWVNKYRYFENGRLKETRMYDGDGPLNTVLIYEYLGDTVSIAKCFYNKNVYGGKRIRKFDKKGNLIKIIDYDSKGKIEGTSIYKNDSNGNNIQFFNYNSKGILTLKSDLLSFDENGNIKYKTNEYKYDERGNVIESIINNNVTRYEYDDIGNWIRSYVNFDGQSEVIEREILYY